MTNTETEVTSSLQVAEAYFEAVARRSVEGMLELWNLDAGTGNIHGIADLKPPEDYRRWFGGFFSAFPDLAFEVLSITAEGEQAAVRWRATGTFNGTSQFEGLEPNGRTIDIQGIDLLTVREGKLVQLHAYSNSVELMRQLGALPDSGSPQERAMMGALNLRTRIASRLQGR